MDIKNAPDNYHKCMEIVFSDLDFVIVYLDNLLVSYKEPQEYLQQLHIVFGQLQLYVDAERHRVPDLV